jgi:hypothetical protein
MYSLSISGGGDGIIETLAYGRLEWPLRTNDSTHKNFFYYCIFNKAIRIFCKNIHAI